MKIWLSFLILVALAICCAQIPVGIVGDTPVAAYAGPTIASGQICHNHGADLNPITCTFPGATTAGHLVLAGVAAGYTGSTLSCTDSTNGAYTAAFTKFTDSGTGFALQFFYFANAASITSFSCSNASSTQNEIWGVEIVGASTTAPIDSHACDVGANFPITLTTVASNVLGVNAADNLITSPVLDWTSVDSYNWYYPQNVGKSAFANAGAHTATATPTTNDVMCAVGLKP